MKAETSVTSVGIASGFPASIQRARRKVSSPPFVNANHPPPAAGNNDLLQGSATARDNRRSPYAALKSDDRCSDALRKEIALRSAAAKRRSTPSESPTRRDARRIAHWRLTPGRRRRDRARDRD